MVFQPYKDKNRGSLMIYAENLKYGIMINLVNESVSSREIWCNPVNHKSRLTNPLMPFSAKEKINILNKYRENSFYAFFVGSPQVDF
jgi:hypothetical protein